MALEQFVNNAATTLDGAINGSSDPVSVVVDDATDFPTTGNFRIIIDDEILLVTAVAGNTFTASRAQENTTIAAHSDGVAVTHILTRASLLKIAFERSKSYYPVFEPGTHDDEFDAASITGWTTVQGSPAVTFTQSNGQISANHPGGGAAAQMACLMKAVTMNTNDWIEICYRTWGWEENFMITGLVMADGATYGAGSQMAYTFSPTQKLAFMMNLSNYNSSGGNTQFNFALPSASHIFLRMTYLGSNNFKGQASIDGISWMTTHASTARTLTPTYVGFGISKWGGANPMMSNFEYFKKGP